MKTFDLVSASWVGWVVFGAMIVILIAVVFATRAGQIMPKKIGMLLAGLFLIQLGHHVAVYTETYFAFRNNPVSKYLLPPHSQFIANRAVADVVSLAIDWMMGAGLLVVWWWLGVKKTKETFIDRRDVVLLVFAALAFGWPGWLIAYAGAFALAVLGMMALVLLRKKRVTDRLIITPYIIPAAILTLVFRAWLLDWTGLVKIRF